MSHSRRLGRRARDEAVREPARRHGVDDCGHAVAAHGVDARGPHFGGGNVRGGVGEHQGRDPLRRGQRHRLGGQPAEGEAADM
ncbi:MAG: hypothetical protein AAFR16_03235, partial [Pseudomonadota bacterium]